MTKRTDNWANLESVARHIRLAADHVASAARNDFSLLCEVELDPSLGGTPGELLESPIEAVFFVWFEATIKGNSLIYHELSRPKLMPAVKVQGKSGANYRLDFSVITEDVDMSIGEACVLKRVVPDESLPSMRHLARWVKEKIQQS